MNILLFAPRFYNYKAHIVEELKRKGHEVFERWSALYGKDFTLATNAIKEIHPKYLIKKYGAYIDKVIDELKDTKIDVVIVIHGVLVFSPETVDKLRAAFKDAKFIYYAWDSFCNCPQPLSFYKKFDVAFSFDRSDAENYGLRFLPLFYPNDPIKIETEYDYCIINSYSANRAENYFRIKKVLPEGLKGREYLYMRRKAKYFYQKTIHPKAYVGLKLKDFEPKRLSREDTYSLMARSKVVVNCPIGKQSGMGFAVFEALRLERKFVTTIEAVKQFDFYTPDNIFVVDDKTEAIPKSFFDTPFNTKYRLSDKYSPESFVNQLLSD